MSPLLETLVASGLGSTVLAALRVAVLRTVKPVPIIARTPDVTAE